MKLGSIITLLLMIPCLQSYSQETDWRMITGKFSSHGKPMIGESILILGTKNGTITDRNGEFCLMAPVDPANLYFNAPSPSRLTKEMNQSLIEI